MIEFNRTVYLDMDNTTFDFDGAAIVNVPENLRVPRKEFYLPQDYPEEMRSLIEDVYNSPDFFYNLEPLPGMLEFLQALRDDGLDFRFLSSPIKTNPKTVEGKLYSLEKHVVPEFGRRVLQEAIFDSNKWRHSGMVLLDDKFKVPRGPDGTDIADWEHVLFGWPHIQDISDTTAQHRIPDYSDNPRAVAIFKAIQERRLLGL